MFRFLLVLALTGVVGCGAFEKDKSSGDKGEGNIDTPPEPPVLSVFEKDVNPILQKSCGACHTEGAKHTAFVGNEAVFKSQADAIAERITTDNVRQVMPPQRTRDPLTAEEKAILLKFLERG